MRTLPGWLAKGGAEGLMCATSSDGVGVAVKSVDGNSRALRPALAAFGELLGVDLSRFAELPVENSHNERAGAISQL